MVAAGLATWTGEGRSGSLIVRGQARLLSDVTQIERLTAIQALFERLEAQETMLRLLELAEQSDGVRIFIGAESGVFNTSGVSMVVAPARNEAGRIVGAIGVIGPTRSITAGSSRLWTTRPVSSASCSDEPQRRPETNRSNSGCSRRSSCLIDARHDNRTPDRSGHHARTDRGGAQPQAASPRADLAPEHVQAARTASSLWKPNWKK